MQPRITFRYKHLGTQYQFSVASPYTPGHQITMAEAQALNQLRSENIRENCRLAFSRAIEGTPPDELLSEETVLGVQSLIDQYDSEYQFTERAELPERLGAIEREARILATGRAGEEATEEEIELLARSIDLLVEARARVEARNKIASTAMEELLK